MFKATKTGLLAAAFAALAGGLQVVGRLVVHGEVEPFDLVVGEFGGSFSAEHGIGPENAEFYRRYVPEDQRDLERRVKQLLDPRGVWGGDPFA